MGGIILVNYEELYHKAFNAITDAERQISIALHVLRKIQKECEEIYIISDDENGEAVDTSKW